MFNFIKSLRYDVEYEITNSNIKKLKDKQSALIDGTPVTIIGADPFEDSNIIVINEESNQKESVAIEDVAELIKPKFLWGGVND